MSVVKEMMRPVVKINSQQTVLEAAKLMKDSGRGSLVVMEGNIAAGIITERDVVMRVAAENRPYTTQVSKVMSTPLVTIHANASLREAARVMFEHKIRRLPVIDGGALVGIVAASDFLAKLSKRTLTEEIWGALTGSAP